MTEGVREQDAEGDIWGYEQGGNWRLETGENCYVNGDLICTYR